MSALAGAFLAGLLFGGGLLISQMNDPRNVLAFLDLAGAWRASLLFTMAAAVAVAAPAYWIVRRSGRSLLDAYVDLPNRTRLDAPLMVGSAIFGLGWGLAGICPGPALLLLSRADRGAIVFAAALVAGMVLANIQKAQGAKTGSVAGSLPNAGVR